jgi:hypothetical protein
MTKLFVSYSQRDAELGQRFEVALRNLGIQTINPLRDMRPGENWRKSIQVAIKQSDGVVTLASTPHSLSSGWRSYELGIAEALDKPVMLLLPNRYPVTELPADFASTQIVEFDPEAPDRAAHDITSRLASAA